MPLEQAAPNKKRAKRFFQSHVDDYKTLHYGSGQRSFMSVRQACYLAAIDRLPIDPAESALLEAGCGPGLMSYALAQRGFAVSAFDTSAEMLRLTESLFDDSDESYQDLRLGDIEAVPFPDDAFDVYVSAGVIEYLDDDRRFLSEALRVLRPGGYMVVSTTNRISPAGYLDGMVEALKRRPWALRPLNAVLDRLGRTRARPREFTVRKHRPKHFHAEVRRAGFDVVSEAFFHFLPWPHPFDRIFPGPTDRLGRRLEGLRDSALRWIGEGYMIVARKPHA